ncbi:MAG: transcription termination/antitermination protein NusA, partial [Candidatus Buchananbacteria bacterium]
LAIGRGGQNVRLASKLTGWKIDIISEDGKVLAGEESEGDGVGEDTDTTDEEVVANQTEE